MATLSADFTLPLRSFELELALEVERTVALVGPSGAGKTSVLRAIAGLVRPPRGPRSRSASEVWLDSARRVFRQPDERRVGLVFQEYALFPHLTVRQNVAYARQGARRRVARALPDLAPRGRAAGRALGRRAPAGRARPRARARAGRAAARRAALGARRAHEGRRCAPSCRSCCASSSCPTLLVTHDFEDAAALADQVGVIVDGRLRQLAHARRARRRGRATRSSRPSPARTCFADARSRVDDELTRVRLESGELVYSTDVGRRRGRRRRLPVGGLGRPAAPARTRR